METTKRKSLADAGWKFGYAADFLELSDDERQLLDAREPELHETFIGAVIPSWPTTSQTMQTRTLYRPVGPAELKLIEDNGWSAFPPRLPEQPLFYPVLNEQYAAQIAERWNVPESGSGYVLAFDVEVAYLERFPEQQVGDKTHRELWVPAEELDEFNRHIVGKIRVVREYGGLVK